MWNKLIYFFKQLYDNVVIKKSLSSLLVKIFGMVVQYVTMLYIIHVYGLDSWGVFTLLFTILNVAAVLSCMGLGNYLVRTVSSFKDTLRHREISMEYASSLVLVLLGSLATVLLLFILNSFFNQVFVTNSVESLMKILVVGLPALSILIINSQTLRGYGKVNFFTLIHGNGLLYSVILTGLLLISYWSNMEGEELLVYITVLGLVLLAFFSFYKVYQKIQPFDFNKVTKKGIKNILHISLPMMLSSSMMFIMGWTDTIILGIKVSSFELGAYNTIFKICSLATVGLFAIGSITGPKIAASYNNGHINDFKQTIVFSSKITLVLTVPIILIILLFPKFILSLFDSNIISYASTLYVLLAGYCISAFCGQVGNILQMTGYERLFKNIIIIATLVNIILNIILIPIMGILGAAVASTISMSFWNICSVFYVKRIFNINMFYIPLLKS